MNALELHRDKPIPHWLRLQLQRRILCVLMSKPSSTGVRLASDELRAWRGFLRTHATLIRELDAELEAEHGLSLTSYDVLVQLEQAPDQRLRMRDLADAVLLSRSGLTRLVDRLVRDGMIERETCSADARGSFAVLTGRGLRVLHAARPTHLAGVRRLFIARVADDELARLGDVWDRMLDEQP
jgi:DNA-binding MarR family transcriptional regulator